MLLHGIFYEDELAGLKRQTQVATMSCPRTRWCPTVRPSWPGSREESMCFRLLALTFSSWPLKNRITAPVYPGSETAFPHWWHVNTAILEKPGKRFTDPQAGHNSLATSRAEFHLSQRLLKIRNRKSADNCAAFVADHEPLTRTKYDVDATHSIPDRRNQNGEGSSSSGFQTQTHYKQGNREGQ